MRGRTYPGVLMREFIPRSYLIPMNLLRLTIVLVMVVGSSPPAWNQHSPLPAAELVQEVVANELTERGQQSKWMYLIDKREGKHILTEEQVETKEGLFYRVVAIDGSPLNPGQQQQENMRMARLLRDPSQQLKLKQAHDDDEQKLQNLMRMLPETFLYDYDGVEGNCIRLKFRPNSNYSPPTYEARVMHDLAGTILIDSQQKRLAKVSGRLISQVDFGFGLLGHIDSGGTIEIGRVPVGPGEWKTALINIQVSGRLMFFKTISRRQYEIRSEFRAVSGELSLLEASRLLAGFRP